MIDTRVSCVTFAQCLDHLLTGFGLSRIYLDGEIINALISAGICRWREPSKSSFYLQEESHESLIPLCVKLGFISEEEGAEILLRHTLELAEDGA